jgi:hypothetical protein
MREEQSQCRFAMPKVWQASDPGMRTGPMVGENLYALANFCAKMHCAVG